MAKAVPRVHNEFTSIYLADSGKKYEFGEKWNRFVVIGAYKNGDSYQYELISEWSDAVFLYEHVALNFEIDNTNGFIHIWTHSGKPFIIGDFVGSSCMFNDDEYFKRYLKE